VSADPRAIDVWTVSFDAPAGASSLALLSADERVRAGRYAFERDRRAFVHTRAALRTILGTYLAQSPEAIAFVYGERGKPRLAGPGGPRFNVSHKAAVALLAFSADCEVGIDVERIVTLDDRDAIAKRYFAPRECAELAALPEAGRDLAFYRCWTRKEAFIKATGEGLSARLDSFCVSLAPGEPARVVAIDEDDAGAWTLHDLAVPPGYAAALAYRDAERPVRLHELR
jgi:4'-phosphopantetheinyl transferase